MDQITKTFIHVALKKNHVRSGKELAMAMLSAMAIWSVVISIVMSRQILQIIVVFKNLTVAIQVNM